MKDEINRPTVSKIKIASRVAVSLSIIPSNMSEKLCPQIPPTIHAIVIAITSGIWAASYFPSEKLKT